MAKQKKQLKHIAVAGNIGSGKTTLTEKLAQHYNWEARFEDVENNPRTQKYRKIKEMFSRTPADESDQGEK